jgi:hypothetical protein
MSSANWGKAGQTSFEDVKMKGIVRFLNLQNGLVAAETNQGFTVFEIRQRCALDIGDEITGLLHSLGEETLNNVTKRESFDVSIENIHSNREEVVKLLA